VSKALLKSDIITGLRHFDYFIMFTEHLLKLSQRWFLIIAYRILF